MKKLMLIVALTPLLLWATQRVLVCEDFTATWCTYCPGAARGLEELYWNAYDSVVVIAYHSSSSDPFYNTPSANRFSYYGISGYPTVVLDGGYRVVGGLHTGTMYPTYRAYFDLRKTTPSPFRIDLAASYDSVARTGQVTATIHNTSGSNITTQLHFALIENHIAYSWQGMDSLHNVLRDMLPNASGEAVTVPAGGSVVRTRNFTINPNWNPRHCMIVVFLQDNASREIHQGAEVAVIPKPNLTFAGFVPDDNNNNVPEPADEINLLVSLRNLGTSLVNNIQAVLSTNDPHITITAATASYGDIAVGDLGTPTTPYTFVIAETCPIPYTANFSLNITATGYATTVNFPLLSTNNPGFTDDVESGQGNWRHSGIRDNWHITEHRSHSTSHSWYCGLENSWRYSNENDARLVSPPFLVGANSRLRFWHYYAMEQDYDFGFVEINNGSGFWSPLATFTGPSWNWTQADYDLSTYTGQTVQVRFRFISDYSVTDEGWYIDDVEFGVSASLEEGTNKPFASPLTNIINFVNPVSRLAKFYLKSPKSERVTLKIYDTAGQLIKTLRCSSSSDNVMVWDLTDLSNRAVQSGVYFIECQISAQKIRHKIVVVK